MRCRAAPGSQQAQAAPLSAGRAPTAAAGRSHAMPTSLPRLAGTGSRGAGGGAQLHGGTAAAGAHKWYLGASPRRPISVRQPALNSSAAMPSRETRATSGPVAPTPASWPPRLTRRRLAAS